MNDYRQSRAKIEGEDGIIYFISASTVLIPIKAIKLMLNDLSINDLIRFKPNRNDFYNFNK